MMTLSRRVIDPNPHNVARQLNKLTDNVILHMDHQQILLFKTLKNLWCSKGVYDYNLLNVFLNSIDADVSKKFKIDAPVTPAAPWIFDNNSIINAHRNKVPVLFVNLLNDANTTNITLPSVDCIVNTLGMYCTYNTRQTMAYIAHRTFQVYNEPNVYWSLLRQLLSEANLIGVPPLRDDICYRFTKLCKSIIHQIRNSV
ncbi:Maph73 [Matsumuraeses phaseoli granulovirus]|uniref:Maph73 n=1 Tax=Matsumuraeses phaseoli granulovirus TaxID=2760664 RepID=A0AAE7MLE8_9BBAC|nr:Maph73 [Matsumuraeses phaseoli granulovirus]QOD40036.1 Maph73 [Matsumuraeses phaseoli granulovirus]